MQIVWQDVRYSLRMLGKNPGFAAIALITLALGIGANTTIFSLLNAVMLQSMLVRNPRELVVLQWSAHRQAKDIGTSSFADCHHIEWRSAHPGSCSFSYPMFKEIRDQSGVFSNVTAFAGPAQLDLSGNGPASMTRTELVSGDYFQTLGVSPALGRTIQPSDERPGSEAVTAIRRIVNDLDSSIPIFDVNTQSRTIDRLLFNECLVARLSSLFGTLAVVLACIGLYGLLSYEVTQRTKELGIRATLGARQRDVLTMIVRQGLLLVLLGTLIGVVTAFGVTRYLQSLLFGVRPTDPGTFLVACITLVTFTLLACYLPARRATRVDPMVALRYE